MKPTPAASSSAFIENGLTEIFGQDLAAPEPGLSKTQSTLLTMKESAFQQFGQPETRGMYLRVGRAAFYYWMRENAENLGWREVEFRLLPAPVRIKRALSDALKWFDDENFLKGELSTTDEAWLISVTGLVGESARLECNSFIGMIQEMVSWAGAGKFFSTREIECQSAGADHCLFEISKQPAG